MESYDFVVIGGGSAGYSAAAAAACSGLKTVCIEGGDQVGGLCILRGCMPSKTFIESANRFLTLRRASEFGLSAGHVAFDSKAIVQRKRELISEFAPAQGAAIDRRQIRVQTRSRRIHRSEPRESGNDQRRSTRDRRKSIPDFDRLRP